ncbi:MAG: NUDIX hydrolase [Myxococcales bacterium]|nr:NUDIX hydrolase [Myxococcales bacterium]
MSNHPRNPSLAVDVIVEIGSQIVLIERKNPPYGWAIPGGFVDYGEPVEVAAVREIKEETGLDVELDAMLYAYSDPSRDDRQHVTSVVFVGQAQGVPQAADDAKNVQLVSPVTPPEPLCFDHAQIIKDYLAFRQTGKTPSPKRRLTAYLDRKKAEASK